MSDAELSILVPVFNERDTVAHAIERLLQVELPVLTRELVVVDDGSTDGTAELLRDGSWPVEVRLVFHERNRGKGAAIRTGLAHARGRWTTIMDADLEYPAENLAPLLDPLVNGESAAVFGARGFVSHSAFSFWYVVGNKLVTLAANVLFNCWLADIMNCHKAMSTDLFRALRLRQDGFAVEAEIAAELLVRGTRIYEVPVSYRARARAAGKKLTSRDGLSVLATLVRCRLRPAPTSTST